MKICRSCSGATLIELLISMALMATLTAGGLAAYAQANVSYHAASTEQRLQQRGEYVLQTLEPELQMAGYFGGVAPTSLSEEELPASVQACGITLLTRLDIPLESVASLPRDCDAHGGLMPGTQVLIMRRASAQATPPHVGGAPWQLHDLIVRAYYISRSADGDTATPALRVKSLTEVAGKPAFIDTEVMPGVEDMQFALQLAQAEPRAIRVTLQLRSDAGDLRAAEPPRHLSVTRHFTLRNALPPT